MPNISVQCKKCGKEFYFEDKLVFSKEFKIDRIRSEVKKDPSYHFIRGIVRRCLVHESTCGSEDHTSIQFPVQP